MMKSILFAFFAAIATVLALPTGAPTCKINEAAPQDAHLQTRGGIPPRTGPLSDGGFIITIDGVTLDPATPLEITAGVNHDVTFTSESGSQPFRGVLGIIHSSSYNFTFTNFGRGDSLDLQDSVPCSDIKGLAGVTHIDRNTKTAVTGRLNIPVNIDEVKLDINMVIANNEEQGSVYYYTQFLLKVTGATEAPSPAPVNDCGLLRLGLFCPLTFCGLFGRLIFGDDNC